TRPNRFAVSLPRASSASNSIERDRTCTARASGTRFGIILFIARSRDRAAARHRRRGCDGTVLAGNPGAANSRDVARNVLFRLDSFVAGFLPNALARRLASQGRAEFGGSGQIMTSHTLHAFDLLAALASHKPAGVVAVFGDEPFMK